MITYKNLSEKSNVESYSTTDNSITVKFRTGKHYKYSTALNSVQEINRMIELAHKGIGLGTMLATKPHHPHDRTW